MSKHKWTEEEARNGYQPDLDEAFMLSMFPIAIVVGVSIVYLIVAASMGLI